MEHITDVQGLLTKPTQVVSLDGWKDSEVITYDRSD